MLFWPEVIVGRMADIFDDEFEIVLSDYLNSLISFDIAILRVSFVRLSVDGNFPAGIEAS